MIYLRPVGHDDDKQIFGDTSYSLMSRQDIYKMINESIAKQHNDRYFQLFAVMNQDECVGFVSLYGHSDTEVSCGPEIRPQYRKKGYAYQAVNQALEYAQNSNYIKAVAQVRKDNYASIALHNKLGFRLCSEFENKKGNWVLWFEKEL